MSSVLWGLDIILDFTLAIVGSIGVVGGDGDAGGGGGGDGDGDGDGDGFV